MHKEQFESVLAEFGKMLNLELEPREEDGFVVFKVDDEFVLNLKYLEMSDKVLLFCPVGRFGGLDAANAGEKALALLRLCDISGPARDITLALDEEVDLVLATSCMSAVAISSPDALAVWMETMIGEVRAVRAYFAENFPEGGK